MDIGRTLPPNVACETRLDALLALLTDGIAVLDGDGMIARWNDAAAAISGISASHALGANLATLVTAGLASLDGLAHDGTKHAALWTFAPQHRPVRAVLSGLRDGSGWVVSFAPQRHYDEIEQLKNELVGSISHELKTPLATIRAYVETMRNRRLTPEETHDYLDTVDEQAHRLGRAIDDLLLVSRVEAGQLLKRRETVALDTVIDAALDAIGFDHVEHPLHRETGGVSISGDPELLRDAFAHVLHNAAKFSGSGARVEVHAKLHDGHCIVAISDAGDGIAGEHIPYIFDRFYRVDRGLDAPRDGSGLGLFIASALVRAHGGTINVRSQPGSGSTFTLALPVRT